MAIVLPFPFSEDSGAAGSAFLLLRTHFPRAFSSCGFLPLRTTFPKSLCIVSVQIPSTYAFIFLLGFISLLYNVCVLLSGLGKSLLLI